MRSRSRFRPVAFTALASLVFANIVVAPALADPDRAKRQADAEQLPGGGHVEADVTVIDSSPEGDGGSDDNPSTGGPGPSNEGGTSGSDGLITYHWVATGIGCWYGESGGEPSSGSPTAEVYERIRVDRTTDPPTETLTYGECFEPDDAPDESPPPPPPPTLEEMTAVAREAIIVPDVQVSPDAGLGGVTGLETWFWYDGQDDATVSVEIRGYGVTASMSPSRYYWDSDDPRGGLLKADRPGSVDEPAARWTYETKDDYEVRIQVVWDGTWSFTGHGASASGDLPTIRATGSADYQVDEVRSELTGTR